jgi:hypothetical protein
MNDINESKVDPVESDSAKLLRDLAARVQAGDDSALPQLRFMLANNPSIWREAGDMALLARRVWLDLLVDSNAYSREIIEHKLDEMREAISGPCPSPLEELLIERVLIGWLQVYQIDIVLAQNQSKAPTLLSELTRRQQAADHRYRASLKQLQLMQRTQAASKGPGKIRLHNPVGRNEPAAADRSSPVNRADVV